MQSSADRSRDEAAPSGRNWLAEPRTGVLAVLGLVVVVGGGRRLLHAFAARKLIARLVQPNVRPEEVEAAARFGRAGLHELFRLQGEAASVAVREAAARAIAILWSEDELIAEEEQALVRRAFHVTWGARRRYPRDLNCEIPIRVRYGLPFLSSEGPGLAPENLEWSHRISGARRAAIEEESSPNAGEGNVEFSIVPADFETDGPHRLALQARVRTVGLTDSWQIELPHVPFSFEFDPRLAVDSLLASPDAAREAAMSRAVRLEDAATASGSSPRFLPLGGELMIRNPPQLVVSSPLPHDLAHRVWIEIEGVESRISGGVLIAHGRSIRDDSATTAQPPTRHDLTPAMGPALPEGVIDRPGRRAIRVILIADPNLGWTDPEVRSVWPGEIQTDWVAAEVVRR
ncbi:hypothetical protein [Paludisphaera borealis]|uniref:Uncharacterized protein n=1 Tax=Paludisphaera borealis TaxID=1387353 RepID=A0A1U7CWK5_9BACT|nr:hypothetical protein [Paludisphaera borealis]APW63315.1 hypothetical protein BSF38_04879 [Paludisphaera borealis]